jgi:hypothetical protein
VLYVTREALKHLDLKRASREKKLGLIVLSLMLSFLTGLTDMNNELGVRAAMESVQAQIAGTKCAVVGICHCNKKADLGAVERLLGSVAFANFVRQTGRRRAPIGSCTPSTTSV